MRSKRHYACPFGPRFASRASTRRRTWQATGCGWAPRFEIPDNALKVVVRRIDAAKAIDYFGLTQGWSAQEVRQRVLTPLDETSLIGAAHTDQHSIMRYQIPGRLTRDGEPIIGGLDIDKRDCAFATSCYPKAVHQ